MVIKNDRHVLKMLSIKDKDVSFNINRRLSFFLVRKQINSIILAINNQQSSLNPRSKVTKITTYTSNRCKTVIMFIITNLLLAGSNISNFPEKASSTLAATYENTSISVIPFSLLKVLFITTKNDKLIF